MLPTLAHPRLEYRAQGDFDRPPLLNAINPINTDKATFFSEYRRLLNMTYPFFVFNGYHRFSDKLKLKSLGQPAKNTKRRENFFPFVSRV
jgi:hypothetical protein